MFFSTALFLIGQLQCSSC